MSDALEASKKRKINVLPNLILDWEEEFGRSFPWRKELDNPYKTFCAEVLLQKTLAKRVRSVYESFFEAFPNEVELSEASKKEVIEVIRPTGLYNKKAEALISGASFLKEKGVQEKTFREIEEKVKGVSSYVTNAVLCFCYEKKVPLFDVNIEKILTNFFDVETRNEVEKILLKVIEKLSEEKLKEFYFGLIDLGNETRSKEGPLLREVAAIVSVDEYSFERFIDEKNYWRFKKDHFKREVSYLATYRTSPTQAITHLGSINEVEETSSKLVYQLRSVFKINPPIELKSGEYPATSFKYSTVENLLNASSYAKT